MILKQNHAIVSAKYGNIKEDKKNHRPFFKLVRQSYETAR